ncbi:hypothetical protein AB4Y45_35005 [Paraburkholderia sp. EG287A]|uniref:hypothetical protein n=1 Tax=Paraburkholderia sp. EG287A TaxID=3237012 RepID=UPI0034D23C49
MEKSVPYRPPRLVAKRYEILRNVKVGAARENAVALAECPVRVATLIDEQAFLAGGELAHNSNVFLEDRHHDWQWRDGLFYYYSRVTTQADVVVVYELEKQ